MEKNENIQAPLSELDGWAVIIEHVKSYIDGDGSFDFDCAKDGMWEFDLVVRRKTQEVYTDTENARRWLPHNIENIYTIKSLNNDGEISDTSTNNQSLHKEI